MFHALIPSPRGRILLRAVDGRLAGLYFVGQKDCPDIAGFPAMRPPHFDPAEGVHQGRQIRSLKALRPGKGASGELDLTPVPRVTDSSASHAGEPFDCGTGALPEDPLPAGYQGPLEQEHGMVFLQADTPLSARALLRRTRDELIQYFNRDRQVFDIPLGPAGTAFQRKVWDALLAIPYGELVSYGDVARTAGMSGSHGRAVGAAVGRNPISIIIPCHRVVSGSGTLTGYSGGLDRKLALLELEGFVLK